MRYHLEAARAFIIERDYNMARVELSFALCIANRTCDNHAKSRIMRALSMVHRNRVGR